MVAAVPYVLLEILTVMATVLAAPLMAMNFAATIPPLMRNGMTTGNAILFCCVNVYITSMPRCDSLKNMASD